MTTTTGKVGRAIRGSDLEEYRQLVTLFPPIKIHSSEEAARTEAQIEELMSLPHLSVAQERFVDLLSDLVADWEDSQIDIPDVSGTDLVRALFEERGLRQKALVGAFATESVASEVLVGRRELSRKHIERLASFFNVSPAAFFPSDSSLTAAPVDNPGRPRTERAPSGSSSHSRRTSVDSGGRKSKGL